MSLGQEWAKLGTTGKVVVVGGAGVAVYFLAQAVIPYFSSSSSSTTTTGTGTGGTGGSGLSSADVTSIVQNAVAGAAATNQQDLAAIAQQNSQQNAQLAAQLQAGQQAQTQLLGSLLGQMSYGANQGSPSPNLQPAGTVAPAGHSVNQSVVLAANPSGKLVANANYAAAVDQAGGVYENHQFIAGHYANGQFVPRGAKA